MATRFEIVDGPSKWDLMLALFDSTCQYPRVVEFKVNDKKRIIGWSGGRMVSLPFRIDTLSRKDGSGENWNWSGANIAAHHLKANGFYSIRTRKGWMEIEGLI